MTQIASSYPIYNCTGDFIKILSIDDKISSFNTNIELEISQIDIKKYSKETIKVNVFCYNEEIKFVLDDISYNLRLVVSHSAKNWSKYKKYLPGDSVSYNNQVYTLNDYIERGISPDDDTQKWRSASDYKSNVKYKKLTTVLYNDGSYYTTRRDVKANTNPITSESWGKFAGGEYILYAMLTNEISTIECKVLNQKENLITLFQYEAKNYYVDDSITRIIDKVEVSLPTIYSYDQKESKILCTNQLLPDSFSKCCITKNNENSTIQYNLISQIKLFISDVYISFDIDIRSVSNNISGLVRFTMNGSSLWRNIVLKKIYGTEEFVQSNINIEAWIDSDGNIYIYLISNSDQFIVHIRNILIANLNNLFIGNTILEMKNLCVDELSELMISKIKVSGLY